MWIAFFAILMTGIVLFFPIIYGLFFNDADFSLDPMSQRDFSIEILNDDNIDNMYSKETKQKYEKYVKAVEKKSEKRKIFFYCLPVIIFMVVLIAGSLLGAFIEKQVVNGEIARYIASKYTIEMSLENTNLTGLERIELVKQASEKNEWLAQKKYDVQQWYRFYLDKDKVLSLEEINLNKGE